MQPANIPAVLIVIALAAASLMASGLVPAAAAEGPQPIAATTDNQREQPNGGPLQTPSDWGNRFTHGLEWCAALVAAATARAPLLMAILSAVLILPAVALVSLLAQSRARRRKERAAARAAQMRADASPTSAAAPLWPHQAWLSLEEGAAGTLPLAGHLIRIGRDRDNDVRLPDASVHRYHAVIEHTEEEAFVITDVSGKDGNGLRINGERLARAELADGDVIELGRTRLRFESVPV